MYRFYSVPGWQLLEPKKGEALPEPVEPLRPAAEPAADMLERAFAGVEYRGYKTLQRARELLGAKSTAVFAQPPTDLPALLRTADQLLTISRQEEGERAKVWRCECGTRYAVPTSLMRPVSIKCERCARVLELDPTRSDGESLLIDAVQADINAARESLSVFFREAMARGWPVLVARSE